MGLLKAKAQRPLGPCVYLSTHPSRGHCPFPPSSSLRRRRRWRTAHRLPRRRAAEGEVRCTQRLLILLRRQPLLRSNGTAASFYLLTRINPSAPYKSLSLVVIPFASFTQIHLMRSSWFVVARVRSRFSAE